MSRSAAAGFTLIEILVAFAILALGLTLLLGTLSGASRQLRQAGDAGEAAEWAQTLLETEAALPLQSGQRQGTLDDGRYRWQMRITPWQDPAQPSPPMADPQAPRLMQIQLDLRWGDGGDQQRLHLQTLRLVRPVAVAGAAP